MEQKERIGEIKRQFRLYMDGKTAQSLRNKGCENGVVWGITLDHLKDIASDYTADYDLALGLWQADVRECKLLATMLMDVKKMDIQTTREWMDQTRNGELAEMLIFNLVQHLPFARELAHEWLESHESLKLLSGLNLYGRLFMNGFRLDKADTKFFLDNAIDSLKDENISIRRAAMNSILRFSETCEENKDVAIERTTRAGYDFL